MPVLVGTRRQLLQGRDQAILFEDNFDGSFISPAKWTPTDTESKISQSGGNLVFAGGKATPVWGDPGLVSKQYWPRAAGLTLQFEHISTSGNSNAINFCQSTPANLEGGVYTYAAAAGLIVTGPSYNVFVPITHPAGQSSHFLVIQKTTGFQVYVSNDNKLSWPILWEQNVASGNPLYVNYRNNDQAHKSQYCRVRRGSVPTPVVNVSQAITPSLGSELVVNGGFTAWTGDNPDSWTVGGEVGSDPMVTQSGNAARIYSSAAFIGLTQANIAAIGSWYQFSANITTVAAAGLRFGWSDALSSFGVYSTTGIKTGIARCTNATLDIRRNTNPCDITLTAISLKALTLSSLVGPLQTARKEGIFQRDVTVAAGYQAGFWMNWDGNTDGTEDYVEALVDRAAGTARLSKCVNGTITDNAITGAITYSAGATLRIVRVGTSYALYYNNAQVGSTATISDAGITDNTGFTSFSTDPNATGAIACYAGINVP